MLREEAAVPRPCWPPTQVGSSSKSRLYDNHVSHRHAKITVLPSSPLPIFLDSLRTIF
jgi:hypothetical protein